MKKFSKKYIGILIIVGTGIALLFAGVTASLAWYTNQEKVWTDDTTLFAESVDTLTVTVPETAIEYDKYMGQTGTQYSGADSPYSLAYSPVKIDYSSENANEYYLKCHFVESVITSVLGVKTTITEKQLIDNFTLRLVLLDYDEGTDTYTETSTVYKPENRFLRDTSTNKLLKVSNGTAYYSIYVYFQGEYAYNLLQTTQANIGSEYTFDFSSETYMFSTFTLNALFEMKGLQNLGFGAACCDQSYEAMEDYTITPISAMLVTGGSLVDADGNARTYPVPELSTADYSKYFTDWFYNYYDESSESYVKRVYRLASSDGVYTMEKDALPDSAVLYSVWGDSEKITLDGNYSGDTDTVVYLRPQSNHYSRAGYAVYDPFSKNLNLYNPSGSSDPVLTGTVAAPTRGDGYVFVGWATQANAAYDSAAGTLSYAAFTAGNGYTLGASSVTLYAVWEKFYTVTYLVGETWGNNYAVVSDGTLLYDGTAVASGITGGYSVDFTQNSDLYTVAGAYTATATATIVSGGSTRSLTLAGWKYLSGGKYHTLSASDTASLTSDVTLYPVWNERGVYTVTLDMYQTWKVLSKTYSVTGKFDVNSALNVERYALYYNGNTATVTGSFIGSDTSNTTICGIPEGATFASLGINIGYYSTSDPFGGSGLYPFKELTLENNNTSGTLGNYDPTAYDTNSAITSDLTLYAHFDNN